MSLHRLSREPRHSATARRGAGMLLVCTGVALVLTGVGPRGFGTNLVYSLCIGMLCWGLIDGMRLAASRWLLARLHDAPPQGPLRHGWPGWGWMAPCVVLGTAGGFVLGAALADLLTGNPEPLLGRSWRWSTLHAGLVATVVTSLLSTAFFYFRGRLAAAEAEVQAARRLAAETQLRLLEAQLEPHMLFNTLANLRVLIALDPPRAQAMLDRLIAFLRATLSASRRPLHPLRMEFERIADYLALMQVRMGERLQAELELPPELAGHPVPPLLLQPLVENAIRHGLEPQRAGGRITVGASRQAGRLRLRVHDNGVGLDAGAVEADGGGFGTRQVRERIAAVYGGDARLTLEPAPGGGTLATLELPLAGPTD